MLTWARDRSGSGLGAKHRRAQIIVEYQGQENRFMKEPLHQHSQKHALLSRNPGSLTLADAHGRHALLELGFLKPKTTQFLRVCRERVWLLILREAPQRLTLYMMTCVEHVGI